MLIAVKKKSFGTASCAPFILRLFQDEKPQTIFNTDLTFGKIVFIAVAGYALFKCVDYAAKQVYGFFQGFYEGFTGKEIVTFEKKIDQLSSLLQKFNNNLSDVKTKLDSIAFDARIAREQLYFFDENDVGVEVLRENLRMVFREFAHLKNAGNGLAAQIEDFGDMLRSLNSRSQASPEFVNLVQRMEEIRQSVNAWNDHQGRLLGESVHQLQEIISNLDNYNSEEINRAVSELRQNIGVIQNVVEQSLKTFANPVLNEGLTENFVTLDIVESVSLTNFEKRMGISAKVFKNVDWKDLNLSDNCIDGATFYESYKKKTSDFGSVAPFKRKIQYLDAVLDFKTCATPEGLDNYFSWMNQINFADESFSANKNLYFQNHMILCLLARIDSELVDFRMEQKKEMHELKSQNLKIINFLGEIKKKYTHILYGGGGIYRRVRLLGKPKKIKRT